MSQPAESAQMFTILDHPLVGMKMTTLRDQRTPLETTTGQYLQSPVPCLLFILRAGNGLVDALSAILPEATIGHLGV